jgi:type VI secretion system secreted protein VgrG
VADVNNFTCIPDSVSFRPRGSPKPVIPAQTAVVDEPPGENLARQVRPHQSAVLWDREGKRTARYLLIRCMGMAGKGWGRCSCPASARKSSLVSEGDPDRPLITGLVYNAEQMPSYQLPDEKTKTTSRPIPA